MDTRRRLSSCCLSSLWDSMVESAFRKRQILMEAEGQMERSLFVCLFNVQSSQSCWQLHRAAGTSQPSHPTRSWCSPGSSALVRWDGKGIAREGFPTITVLPSLLGWGQALGLMAPLPAFPAAPGGSLGPEHPKIWECHPSPDCCICKLTRKWEFCLYERSLINHQSPPLMRGAVAMVWTAPGCA